MPWLSPLFIALYALFLGFVFLVDRRSYRTADTDEAAALTRRFRYLLVVVLLFIITNKVYSLQYIAWVLPFAMILSRRQSVYLFIIFLFSVLMYPFTYQSLLHGQLLGIVVLNIRNASMLLLVADVFWDILRHYRAQRLR